MTKIAIIGAGGQVFPLRLIADILCQPACQNAHFALMDIDPITLQRTELAARALIAHHGLPASVSAGTDQRAALRDAKYVLVTFQVGGLRAYLDDLEIPRRHGVDQAVGDTLGPGGVMRFLRTSKALNVIADDMLELCPQALVINYANPMAMNCWYLSSLGIKTVGLCHSIQNTTHMLAKHLEIPYQEIHYKSAGINHQAWLLEFKRGDQDLMPAIREIMRREHLERTELREMVADTGDHSEHKREWTVYEGGQEQVRTWLMEAFGFFHTESSHHASEYVPWFRKNTRQVLQFIPERWDIYAICEAHNDEDQARLLEKLKAKLEASLEYGARIIQAIESGEPCVIYGNVPNHHLIDNLPFGCCVEVPCLVDKNGVQPTRIGKLPLQLAALNRTNINVQELAVEAALTGNRDHVFHAIALDPLTGALLTLEQIRKMTNDLLHAEREWLPDALRLPERESLASDDSSSEKIHDSSLEPVSMT